MRQIGLGTFNATPEMLETWAKIDDYPGYEVSNLGKIRSYYLGSRRGLSSSPVRILSTKPTKLGYSLVKLFRVGQSKKLLYVHHIVAHAFLGDKPAGREVCHKDDDRLNNTLDNLYYGTPSQNRLDAIKNGKLPYGENHYRSILSTNDILEIRKTYSLGGITQDKLATLYETTRGNIKHIILGDTWKSVGGPIRGIDYA